MQTAQVSWVDAARLPQGTHFRMSAKAPFDVAMHRLNGDTWRDEGEVFLVLEDVRTNSTAILGFFCDKHKPEGKCGVVVDQMQICVSKNRTGRFFEWWPQLLLTALVTSIDREVVDEIQVMPAKLNSEWHYYWRYRDRSIKDNGLSRSQIKKFDDLHRPPIGMMSVCYDTVPRRLGFTMASRRAIRQAELWSRGHHLAISESKRRPFHRLPLEQD